MPPKKIGMNSKAALAADRRAEQDSEKQRKKAMEDERKEAEEWNVGANSREAARRKVHNTFDCGDLETLICMDRRRKMRQRPKLPRRPKWLLF